LEEELLIQTEVNQTLDPVEHHYEEFSIRLIPCQGKILSIIPMPAEHSDSGGIPIQEIPIENRTPAALHILGKLLKQYFTHPFGKVKFFACDPAFTK
jgi:hypothetical protein